MTYLRFLILIALLTTQIICGQVATASDFELLRANLQKREGEPKVFLPDRIIVGQPAEIVVVAPGAEEIALYGTITKPSFANDDSGKPKKDDEEKKEEPKEISYERKLLGKKELTTGLSRVKFEIVFENQELINHLCSFEALIAFEKDTDEEDMYKAMAFGSNAAYRGSSLVRIIDTPRAKSNPLDSLNTLLPGLKPLNFR